MNNMVKPIATVFQTSGWMYDLGFEAITEEQSKKQLAEGANSNTWLMAHLATCRYHIAKLMGLEVEDPWNGTFDKTIGDVEAAQMPTLKEIKEKWDSVSKKIEARLPELDDSYLNAEAPFKFPTQDNTNWAALSFMAMHEAYHVGQISHNRRLLGVDTLFGMAVKKMKEAESAESTS